jgi:hypothetical protein
MMSDNEIVTTPLGQHLHDLRAVHDMGNLRLDPGTSDRPWSVLRLAPDPHSGSATLEGAAIDGATGNLIDVATGKPAIDSSFPASIIEEGSWELLTRIGAPRGKQRGHYQWTKPMDYRKKRVEPNDIYGPFSRGGIVLCRHNSQIEGMGQFESVNLLPLGWESDVRPAFDSLQKNKALSAAPASAREIASLRVLLGDKNRIISSIAARSLAESGNLDSLTLQQALSKSAGYQRAVLMYVALVHPPAAEPSTVEPALTQAVQNTSEGSNNRAAVLASTAAVLFHPELPKGRTLGVKLLNSIRSRPVRALAAKEPDPYVDQLLKLT